MATNFYFNNFQASQEQLLIENLIIESIKIYGMDMIYLPRTRTAFDTVYGEDPLSEFNDQYGIEMYIKNIDGFGGDGEFLSKFNIEIRDRVTFTVARRAWNDEVGASHLLDRPLEGDLIYFPLNKKIFEIKFVEHEAIFYQLGSLQTYDIVCELFTYSNERFNTGVEDIDKMYEQYSTSTVPKGLLTNDLMPYYLTDENGFKLVQEEYDLDNVDKNADNDEIQEESLDFVDFTVIDPFSEGRI
jgi:hypothetical protein